MKGVLVLCPPRSGSSCLTACISLCGASIGKNPTTIKDEHNSKGYYENKSFMAFNESLLRPMGKGVMIPTPLTEANKQDMLQHKPALSGLLSREFSAAGTFVLKDPRIIDLWPLYHAALKEFCDIHIVTVARPSEHSAKSLNKMYGTPMSVCEGIIEKYKQGLSVIFNEHVVLSVSFSDVMNDTESVMHSVCSFTGLSYTKARRKSTVSFVEKKLVNF